MRDCVHPCGCIHEKICEETNDCVGKHGYRRIILDGGASRIVPRELHEGDKENAKRIKRLLIKGMEMKKNPNPGIIVE